MMRRRATPSGVRLTEREAAVVKGMLRRGDRQHDIAAWFGVNGGRIAEIAKSNSFAWVNHVAEVGLPPVGPYPAGKLAVEAQRALDKAREALVTAESVLRKLGTGSR